MGIIPVSERERQLTSRLVRRARLVDTLIAVIWAISIGVIALGLSLKYFPQ